MQCNSSCCNTPEKLYRDKLIILLDTAQINPNEEFKMRRLCLVPGAEKSQSDSIWKVAAELVEEVGILKTRGKYETATRLSKLLEAEKGTVGGLEFLSSDDGKSWGT